jgi:3'-phosphoadenosine 5'-phosphosulfate sulfotransferase (PAPS reductase)/FAD synthetase
LTPRWAARGETRRRPRVNERVFSVRDPSGAWDPRSQRPELWPRFNTKHRPGEHLGVFPLSNWTDLDIWHYIQRGQLPLPSLYFSHATLGTSMCQAVGTGGSIAIMQPVDARYESGVLTPAKPLALRPGEWVSLVVVRRPDPSRWTIERLSAGAASDDSYVAEPGHDATSA